LFGAAAAMRTFLAKAKAAGETEAKLVGELNGIIG